MTRNHIMREAILNFAKQFDFEPKIENENALVGKRGESVILAGMGGSHLAGDILQMAALPFRISLHQDYGLPSHIPEKELVRSFVIANSYSGNTEETLSAFDDARERGLPLAAIATGGALLEKAKETNTPYIEMPNTGIQPRSALGFNFRALAALLGLQDILRESRALAEELHPEAWEDPGQELAERLSGKIPVVYSSQKNYAVAYNWKIKLNETGKVPVFYNVLPELNHNEMNGFSAEGAAKDLCEKFVFIFLRDASDHPKIIRRMDVLEGLYRDRNFSVEKAELFGETLWKKVFSSLLLADWTAYALAEKYGLEANDVPMTEEFKKLIA